MEYFFGILISVIFSAFFSGTEIAYVSASKLQVELIRRKGTRRGQILSRFYDKPDIFLAMMLVGNSIALVVFTYFMNKVLNQLLGGIISPEYILALINTFLITAVILVLGEFLPKALFRNYANQIILGLAYPLQVIYYLLVLPTSFLTGISNFLLRYVFKTHLQKQKDPFTRVDLENFIITNQTLTEEQIDTDLFGKALNLTAVKVKECMIPRTEIEAIDLKASIRELHETFAATKLSRLLVYKEDINNVIGYVHHQQLLNKPRNIQSILMEIPFVPEVMRLRDLLNRFIKERWSIACVVDEYGATVGLITLEDILEQLVGDIEDEHDEEEYVEQQISETEFLFSGRLEIDYLNDTYGLDLPKGDYHTLSGYLVLTIKTIPETGAVIHQEPYQFILEQVSERKIETVRVILEATAHEKETE